MIAPLYEFIRAYSEASHVVRSEDGKFTFVPGKTPSDDKVVVSVKNSNERGMWDFTCSNATHCLGLLVQVEIS